MKRTSLLTLLVMGLLGLGSGFLMNHLLTISGRATFMPSVLLILLLLVLAGAILFLAWPVRASLRGGARVDPIRAVRTAVLARALSLVGTLVGGFSLGLLLYLLSRPINPPTASVLTLLFQGVTAGVVVVAAMISEQWCTIPKDHHDNSAPNPDV